MRHQPATTRVPDREPRAAFTLLELLIVISIIALLVSLLVPAINSVVRRVRQGEVVAEITGLGNACDNFKAEYHAYPPSKITLFEEKNTWTPESKALMRRIFGLEFRFDIDRDINGQNGVENDPDGDGNPGVTLDGAECLVFFLGGIPSQDSNGNFQLNGFSRNKADPFSRSGSNRLTFFTDWRPGALHDEDGDGFPEYHDKLNPEGEGPPLLYLSTTNASNSYNGGDVANVEGLGASGFIPYNQGSASSPWKPGGFQLISAGFDHKFGTGGSFTKETANNDLTDPRDVERDNLTNFIGGALNE